MIIKPLWPTTPKMQKKAKMTQDCKSVALKLPKISLRKGCFGQLKGYSLCSGNVGGFFRFRGWPLPQGLYNRSNPKNLLWEIDFYPVGVLGWVVFSLYGRQTPARHWIKNLHPRVQEFYPVLGLGSGGRLLRHFQTPTLGWIHVSLRF